MAFLILAGFDGSEAFFFLPFFFPFFFIGQTF
jgi:hypothetical protein